MTHSRGYYWKVPPIQSAESVVADPLERPVATLRTGLAESRPGTILLRSVDKLPTPRTHHEICPTILGHPHTPSKHSHYLRAL